MTHDSTHLDSLNSLPPILVIGQSTLYTFSFHVSLFLMYLSLTCIFFLPARLLIMVVVPFLILTLVLLRIVAPGLWLVLAIGSVILLIFESLTGYIFLQLILCASRLPLLMSLLLPFLPRPTLLSGIII
jgi:hypothetical protein